MSARVYAAVEGGKVRFDDLNQVATFDKPVVVSDEVADQLEREIAGDPGCADQERPCDRCLAGCAEHEVFRNGVPAGEGQEAVPGFNELNPHLAHLPHFDHVCVEPAWRGHVGVPGRKDVRVERDPAPEVEAEKPTKKKRAAEAAKE